MLFSLYFYFEWLMFMFMFMFKRTLACLMSERATTLEISCTSQLQKDEDHSHAGWLEQCQPLRKWLCKWSGQQPSWRSVYILTTTESKHTSSVLSSSFPSYFQPSQRVLCGKPQSAVYVQQQNAKNILYFFRVMGVKPALANSRWSSWFSCQCHVIVAILLSLFLLHM